MTYNSKLIKDLELLSKSISKHLNHINNTKSNKSIKQSNILFDEINDFFISNYNLDIEPIRRNIYKDGASRKTKNLALSDEANALKYFFLNIAPLASLNQENASIFLSKIINHNSASEDSITDQYPRIFNNYKKEDLFTPKDGTNILEYNIVKCTFYFIKMYDSSNNNKILDSYLKNKSKSQQDTLSKFNHLLKYSHDLLKIYNIERCNISLQQIKKINKIKSNSYSNYLDFISDLQKIDKNYDLSSKIYLELSRIYF